MQFINDQNYSYWERKHFFNPFDLLVIGSGIVGLSTAISFREKNPRASVLILESGFMPNGASTKNAGFACFGSAGEVLDDLSQMPETSVWKTVKMRSDGLQILRDRLKDKNIDYRPYGGFELFTDEKEFLQCREQLPFLNKEMKRVLGFKTCYSEVSTGKMRFNGTKGAILNAFEGQLDTQLMMKNLTLLARKKGIEILNGVTVSGFNDLGRSVEIISDKGIFKALKVVVATNGFAKTLLSIKDVEPARAQVLITKPITNLKIKGAFHFFKGYYYFRNIDNRILFGGGRNLDFKKETTQQQGLNSKIQDHLQKLLKEMILPDTRFEIDQRWSGIMGVGSEKQPIIKFVSANVLAAVRMGGMGIAIGSYVGEEASKKIS
ncbi:FAD-dependent oxidoreductase [Sphingobacteriaceae bacterium]|nr:FAD-dependent oxidoreductase [Sphingobacteriaceae bacterium]